MFSWYLFALSTFYGAICFLIVWFGLTIENRNRMPASARQFLRGEVALWGAVKSKISLPLHSDWVELWFTSPYRYRQKKKRKLRKRCHIRDAPIKNITAALKATHEE